MSLPMIILRFAFISVSVEGLIILALPATAIFLEYLGINSDVSVALINATALVAISALLNYFWIVRPYVAEHLRTEAILSDAIESISEGFLMYDPEDRLILCNSRFRELYALASDIFVLGSRFEDILKAGVDRGQYPEAKKNVAEWISDRLTQHRELSEPIERELPDGRWVKITERRTRNGYTVGIRTDITDLKSREHQLQNSEEQLRQIVASLQEGFVLYDAADRIVMWNERWLEIHNEIADMVRVGLSFEELARECVVRKIYPEAFGCEEEFVAERIARHRNPGEPIIRQLHDNRWYIIREVPTGDGGTFAISIDITELKNAETIAAKACFEAERANSAKTKFLANMSHELRTPLNAIIGFSDVIQNEAFGPVGSISYREYAADINQSGRHLLALINDMLDLSKIEAGMDELHEEHIVVPEIIQSAATFVRQHANEKGVELDLEIPADAPALFADERKLKQILINLMSNAIKFTEGGGMVRLKSWWCLQNGYVFQVSDTGIGIAPDDIPNALARFGQVMGAANQDQQGTGLGLPLTKAIIETHGGSFSIQSEVGVGTTVTARFPAERIIRRSDRARCNGRT